MFPNDHISLLYNMHTVIVLLYSCQTLNAWLGEQVVDQHYKYTCGLSLVEASCFGVLPQSVGLFAIPCSPTKQQLDIEWI